MQHITLIGMSNIGKSYHAHQLAQRGYIHIDCDELTAKALHEVKGTDVHALAKWMGQPPAPYYKERSQLYLERQACVMRAIITAHTTQFSQEGCPPAVIDTTGSVVYLDQSIQDALKAMSSIVYLEGPQDHVDVMLAAYRAVPKPLVWGDVYAPMDGETHDETINRCYPLLMAQRAQLYERLAHVIIPYEMHRGGVEWVRDIAPTFKL